ncbi:hypothetical protein Ahy_B10g102098 [Arachis hypogaea]|uniref:Uncharacterized protein n=1 Tax=Arachis hypogaea TaxID=3818 RepID=A0A444X120_ARAHY|nr:hypothetical protein Ahy_B10g102098 [Arachis hypogaea]
MFFRDSVDSCSSRIDCGSGTVEGEQQQVSLETIAGSRFWDVIRDEIATEVREYFTYFLNYSSCIALTACTSPALLYSDPNNMSLDNLLFSASNNSTSMNFLTLPIKLNHENYYL